MEGKDIKKKRDRFHYGWGGWGAGTVMALSAGVIREKM
jgi:hypothetical protein